MASLRRINQEDLRNHNLSVVLDTLLRAEKPMSRADLAKETGLTKATLSLLASMLIDSGVVQEGEPVVSTTYGRPSTPLEIRGGSIAGIGLQINTDGYGCLALDLNGDTLGREWVSEDMTGTDPYEIFAKLDAMTFPLESRLKRRGCKVVGAGFALPGIVTDDMWLLVARNLGWENVNLTRFNVVRRLDAVAGNEAKMAAIAQIPGYATERASFLNVVDRTDSFIYLSTDIGIGGAVVRDGEVVMGSHGFAGEIGHLSVAMDGPLCSCGRHGCLEAFAGRRALVEAAGIAEDGDATSSEAIDMFLQRWRAGDSDVAKVVDQAADALVSAIASAVNLVDVDTVLLGGLWTHFGDELATVLEGRLRSEILGYPNVKIRVFVPPVALHPSLYGAAEMGLRRFIENPLGYMGEK
ncbi:ROK family transcriptional regulator [Bifidobacterium longum]|nr:ROK family transcriptional regulator [Bifidobacterium longum]MDB6686343.1 ROK family transcriptional regulator [Bifidobacterium longum]MDB6688275.1 ROK family transcriptional regulator [Bifidobacterium longum]MDB6690233.1 ROK family transcriptional regulator [Bifidobacterium longum]MDB6692223.1 ROK family transcriptional regulator [Bifidobacterium longum]